MQVLKKYSGTDNCLAGSGETAGIPPQCSPPPRSLRVEDGVR
jgi:hypothetical protein